MEMSNIIIDNSFFAGGNINVHSSISGLAKLKKLKTSEEKYQKLEGYFEPVEEVVFNTPVIGNEAEIVAEPTVELNVPEKEDIVPQEEVTIEPVEINELPQVDEIKEPVQRPYSFEQPEQVVPQMVTNAYNYETKEEVKAPVYSFEQPQVYAENKLTSSAFDYNGMNGLTPTERFERDFEYAEGPIEKQVLGLGVKELKAKDEVVATKREELRKIEEEEKRIKEEKANKQKEVEDSIKDKKTTIAKIETAVSKAKQADNLNKMAEEKEEQEKLAQAAREAKYQEEQKAIEEQKNKVISEIPFDLTKEEEKEPVAIEQNDDIESALEEGSDIIAQAREFIRSLDPEYAKKEGFGRTI